jgi:N-acylneuraminate cytidylyltransferase
MIYWPLSVLSKLFPAENVLVSTDSDQIKATVEKKGLIVPFKRPEELSDDFTGTAEVVKHAVEWFETNVRKVDYVLTVYPTAVLLSKSDLLMAMETLYHDPQSDSIMSATSFPFPIQRAVFENKKGYAEMFEPNNYSARSQDLVEAKHDAGQFYLNRVQMVRSGKLLTNSNVKLLMLSRNKVIDIDTIEDFEIAEEKLRTYNSVYENNCWTFDKDLS